MVISPANQPSQNSRAGHLYSGLLTVRYVLPVRVHEVRRPFKPTVSQ